MLIHHPPGIGPDLIAFVQDRHGAPELAATDPAQRQLALADFNQLIRLIECGLFGLWLKREEIRQADGDAIQNAAQRPDRRVHLVGLDHRDRGIGHIGPFGQRALRQPLPFAQDSQPLPKLQVQSTGVHVVQYT